MIDQLLYIAGPPGVGKSTLARELTAGWDKVVHPTERVPHVSLLHPASRHCFGIELGVPRPAFSGTDALAMDIGPRALDFLLQPGMPPFALGEGSRLATRPFMAGLVRAGVRILFVSLTASQEVLDERWRARGSKQNPSWRKGAATRARRMTEWAMDTDGVRVLRMDGFSPAEAAEAVRNMFPLIDLGQSVA